jgi:hypothetical protein
VDLSGLLDPAYGAAAAQSDRDGNKDYPAGSRRWRASRSRLADMSSTVRWVKTQRWNGSTTKSDELDAAINLSVRVLDAGEVT